MINSFRELVGRTTCSEGLVLKSGCGEDRVPPDVEDVIVEELEYESKDGHGGDDPDELVRVETQLTIFDNLCRESTPQKNHELDEVKYIKGQLSCEC